jgi:glycosidase
LFQLSFIGTPCIYYGDEIGMAGGQDPGCRACMIWDEDKQDRQLFKYVKQLIELRKSEPAFGNGGKFRFIHADNKKDYIIYEKYNDQKRMIFIINNSDVELEIPVVDELIGKAILEYSFDHVIEKNKLLFKSDQHISIDPFGFRIFEC